MDIKIHRPHGCCHESRRPFTPGEIFFSALVRSRTDLERFDCAAECWRGPPAHALAWWRSTYPAARDDTPELAPIDVLLDVLEHLEGRPDDSALRYLLALELLRRRVVRIVEGHASETVDGNMLQLACRRRDTVYRVAVAPPASGTEAPVQERLASLLWSGGAA